jgi:hypothetical protein
MLRLILLFLVAISFVSVLSGQKNEIPEGEFLSKEAFANETITKSNRRLIRTLEYFEDRSKPGHLSERYTEEVLFPNRWRRIEEKDYAGKKTREERIWDGTALYVRSDDGEWRRYSGGANSGARIESGRITKTYRYLGLSDVDGKQAATYQVQSVRVANKFSANDMVVLKYVRDSRYWFDSGGRLLKKVEETMIEGQPAMSRETTFVEYDPKISIEAPIK